MYKPSSRWTWSFAILVLVQAAVIVALEAYCFAVFQDDLTPRSRQDPTKVYTMTIPTFFTLYIFGMFYELVLVWDALRLKNTIQVFGLCMYNIACMVYGAVQIQQTKDALANLESTLKPHRPNPWLQIKSAMYAIPCVLAFVSILMSILAWKLYDEFAWTIYKHISADLKMKRRYLTFQIYIALLKFDFFFFLGFTIQFLVIVQGTSIDAEFGLTIAAIPITIAILLLAAFWTRREQMLGMIFVVIIYFAALAYFVFKLVRIWSGSRKKDYLPAAKPLTAFAAITIVLIIATIVAAIRCMMNFNKGLKPHVMGRKVESEEEKNTYVTEMPNLNHGPVPNRMTID